VDDRSMLPPCFYLGPEGTFTEIAARALFPAGRTPVPLPTVADVVARVDAEDDAVGVVPVENSVNGEVTSTIDLMLFTMARASVVGATTVPVTFEAFAVDDTVAPGPPDGPRPTVVSHPHALAQCRRFIDSLGATTREASSTAEACRIVAELGDESFVALAAPGVGARLGLRSVATRVEDFPGAATRFLALGHDRPARTSDDRTMLVVVPPSDRAGVLAELLTAFSARRVNLFSLHSRPLRSTLGQYCFILTADSHHGSGPLRDALRELLGSGHAVKVLGSYPASGAEQPGALFAEMPGLLHDPAELDV
jgi:prephenate dehydratase